MASVQPRLNRAILDSLPARVAVIDPAGTILAANRAWAQTAGWNGTIGPAAADIGGNFFATCRDATGPDAPAAAA
ncbi:MAG TPA: PAS domain-containing protein, partial [Dehalococcoidia bacterium]|nr:PAS domain-containing protein [Dehalococcoidia bacterium]